MTTTADARGRNCSLFGGLKSPTVRRRRSLNGQPCYLWPSHRPSHPFNCWDIVVAHCLTYIDRCIHDVLMATYVSSGCVRTELNGLRTQEDFKLIWHCYLILGYEWGLLFRVSKWVFMNARQWAATCCAYSGAKHSVWVPASSRSTPDATVAIDECEEQRCVL